MDTKALRSRIKTLVAERREALISLREDLHREPELSFEEEKTSARVQAELSKVGIDYTTGYCTHGVVGLLGRADGPCIALRADMDALPIQEQNETDYKSQRDGLMHACGHDVHTTCLIGTAWLLKAMEDELPGQVKLIFQPGEEKLPGGASIMIRDGALENPRPALMIGQHVHPPMESGDFGFRAGQYMASCDEIYIDIKGKGGHAALPHQCHDPIVCAADLIQSLQQLVSRRSDPVQPIVLTIGKIWSHGGATNIIPDQVTLQGTLRCMNEELRKQIHDELAIRISSVAKAHQCKAELDLRIGYPYLQNDEQYTHLLQGLAAEYLGDDRVHTLDKRMTAEDFAYYSQVVPSVFYRLGVRNEEKGIIHPVHTPRFDVDEESILHGVEMMTWLAIRSLAHLAVHTH